MGETELVADQYHIDASGGTFSASIETDLEVFGLDCVFIDGPFADCSPIGPFEVTVAVTWDDVSGRLYPEVFTSTSHFPGEVGVTTERGMARCTNASGEITGDLPATLDVSFVASIARVDARVRFVAF